jgi:release factor glutamine methyltransferase
VSDPIGDAARRFAQAGLDSPRLDARVLWQRAKSLDASASLFETFVNRRLAHEPIAYIVGHKEFWSLDFAVGPGVLIPRPDTETLVEQALKEFPDRDRPVAIADLGTGSGCLLIAALTEYPNAHGVGIDTSEEALAWARRNVASHHLEDRATLIETGWLDGAEPGFDIVFSNPPYIPSGEIDSLAPDVSRFEPRAALDGGPDGLDAYRAITERLPSLLTPAGRAFLELGQGEAAAVAELAIANGLNVLRTVPDLAGILRCVVLALGR